MLAYLDSSVILRHILRQSDPFCGWTELSEVGCSELGWIECHRTVDRFRLGGKLNDEDVAVAKQLIEFIFEGMEIFSITPSISQGAAGSFPTVVGTLDAIHLSTALLWRHETGQPVRFLTHDIQLARAASALGLTANL